MDSSEVTRRRKQQAIYKSKLNIFIAKNPTGDCANDPTQNCIRTFASFDEKYSYYAGRNACVQGCPLPITGGSK